MFPCSNKCTVKIILTNPSPFRHSAGNHVPNLALHLVKSFWQVQEPLRKKKKKGFVNLLCSFFCHKQMVCFICKAGQTCSSQNIGQSHESHDWKAFPTAAVASQSQPGPYHAQKCVQCHVKAWICALHHDSSSISPTEAPQRTWVMPHSIPPHHTHYFYFLAEAVHLQIMSVASVCLVPDFSPLS